MMKVLLSLLLAASGLTGEPSGAPALTNASFEAGTTAGWSSSNGAAFVEAGGHGGGAFRLTHWASTAYEVQTEQRLTGLRNGSYTLRVWVRTDST